MPRPFPTPEAGKDAHDNSGGVSKYVADVVHAESVAVGPLGAFHENREQSAKAEGGKASGQGSHQECRQDKE